MTFARATKTTATFTTRWFSDIVPGKDATTRQGYPPWSCLLSLCIDETQRKDVFFFFWKNKITDKLISAVVNEFATEFESFVLSSLEKYQQFLHMGPWSATYDPRELTFLKADKENLR